jgi:ribonuclease Z
MISVTFLGTSAHIPLVSRSHPAFLLSYEGENILVDCGEGTQRQFRIAKINPCKITRILITHLHGDHVFGLPGLLSTLNLNGYNKTLFVYGPKGIKQFFCDLVKVFRLNLNYKIEIHEVSGRFFETSDFYLESKEMTHGILCNAYAFILKERIRINKEKLEKSKLPAGAHLQKLKEGKDIVYQGKKYLAKSFTYLEKGKKISFVLDTSFNKRIVPFVKNSSLLVCEATFDSDMNDKARDYLHLTSKQAGEIAKRARVEKLILTHLSQRYEKNSKKILDGAKKVFKNTIIAKDFDVVKV